MNEEALAQRGGGGLSRQKQKKATQLKTILILSYSYACVSQVVFSLQNSSLVSAKVLP
jgi:hypothetical protein